MTTPAPTIVGRPRRLGSSRCSTEAKNASASACRIDPDRDTNVCSHWRPHPSRRRLRRRARLGCERVRRTTRIGAVVAISLLVGQIGAGSADARQKGGALTFDGGPSGYTRQIDRILQRKHARATFFWVGSRVDGWEKVVKRVDRQGHEIANHSWFHDDLTMLPASA